MSEQAAAKDRAKAVWALGDYARVAERIAGGAEALVAAAGIGDGERVLDVAAGTGNATVAAARAGARVTATDFAPSMLAAGRARTEALGLDVIWEEADAEVLPYADGSFDAVVSAFGLMFAPRPETAIAEAFRVVRPGGRVGVTAWTPTGYSGSVVRFFAEYLPAPPSAAEPGDWGDEAKARDRFAVHAGDDVQISRGTVAWTFADVAEAIRWQEEAVPPMVAARAALGERYPEIRERLAELTDEWARPDGDGIAIPADYLITIGRRPA